VNEKIEPEQPRAPEDGRGVEGIAPKTVERVNQRITDQFIDEIMRHDKIDHERAEEIKQDAAGCSERIDRLEQVFPKIDSFLALMDEKFPKMSQAELPKGMGEVSGERIRIREALTLMLKLHVNQSDRVASSEPFVGHPLDVATEVLETYKGNDISHVVVAALLHDSIEDQAHLLALEKKLALQHKDVTPEQIEHEGALHGLGRLFGLRSQLLVQSVTRPKRLSIHDPRESYEDYIRNIFYKSTLTPASAVIKWADLKQNAFIGDLYERAQMEKESGNEKEYERVMYFYERMKKKYRPVLEMVREWFTDLDDKSHPLFEQRDAAIAKIDDVLENQYSLT